VDGGKMFESRYKYRGEVRVDYTPMTPDDIARELEDTMQKVVVFGTLKFLNSNTGETLMTIPEVELTYTKGG
jgi:hypothetical protein